MNIGSNFAGVFKNIPIAKRLSIVVFLALAAFAVAMVVYVNGEKSIQVARQESTEFRRFAEKANSLQESFQSLKLPLLSYTGRHDEGSATNFNARLSEIEKALADLVKEASTKHRNFLPHLEGLQAQVSAVSKLFSQVENQMNHQGFDREKGLWKKLVDSVSAVEKEIKSWPKTEKLQAKLAVMKSYEADFMLRKDLVALQKHKKNLQ